MAKSNKPKQFPMRDLSRLFRICVIERNLLRDHQVKIHRSVQVFASFIKDYIIGMVEIAMNNPKGAQLYKGQVIEVVKFPSENSPQWDAEYGLYDYKVEMKHKCKHATVTFDSSFRDKILKKVKDGRK